MEKREIIIDATDKRIGRIASEVARHLTGKGAPDYTPNRAGNTAVVVKNADKIYVSEKKRAQKEYVRYSGYPGGKKVEKMGHLIGRKGIEEVLRKAVYGMLPGNKLRKERMKALTVEK